MRWKNRFGKGRETDTVLFILKDIFSASDLNFRRLMSIIVDVPHR